MTTMRRIKRKCKTHKSKILGGMAILIVIIAVFILLPKLKFQEEKVMYEITEVDLFDGKNVTSDQVTFKGVKIGDSQQTVIDKMGYPDAQTLYQPDITNMEFGKSLGLNESGIILQFKKDSLTKITFRPNADDFLRGNTKIMYDTESLVKKFGAPDSVKHMPLSPNSPVALRVYTYKEGFQFVTRSGPQIAFSLFKKTDLTEF